MFLNHQNTTLSQNINWSEKSKLLQVNIAYYRFLAFIVSHQVTIKVRKFEGLGKMTDQLLLAGDGLIIIDSF